VILLTTNLFKKELSSGASLSQYEIGLALNCLANIVTKDLARDCISDVVSLMNHTRPYVRKKAILTLYKMFIKFPQGLRLTFERLKERLDDSESSVISCAVNVICELANKNPKNYLAMAPKFFRLLTTSSNNWMLIKVVKLMGSLVSEEPRLARKLLEPLATIIQNTGAKSLQYECIHTITESLLHTKREDGTDAKNVPVIVKLCSDYLRGFIEEHDQNLKYLGLVGLVNLLKSHPRQVVEHREIILRCLNDDDNTIRVRALELLAGIVSKKSLVDLVHHLLEHAKRAEGNYRDEIISKVLFMCSKEKYALVTDFAWYVSVLLDLAVMQGSKHGKEVADQLIDVAMRVDNVRPFAVESMLSLLLNEKLILGVARQTVSEVLKAAAWIVGEYSQIVTSISNDTADDAMIEADENAGYWIEGPASEDIRSLWRGQDLHAQVIDALLNPRATNLPAHVQCAYIQAAMKIFIRACCDRNEPEVASIIGTLRSRLTVYLQSQHIEVQERASTLRHILSEFGILPLDWEATATKSSNPSEERKSMPSTETILAESMKSSASTFLVDLLDPTAAINTQTAITKPIDDDGARKAKLKSKVLLTAIAEPFYAVHAKAQRKVPVPEGLSLEAAIKESALQKLLQVDIPSNITISTLYFIPVAPAMNNYPPSNFDHSETDNRNSNPATSDNNSSSGNKASLYTSFMGENTPKFSSASSGVPSSAPLPPPRNPDENLFYLSASSSIPRDAGILPLSQMLADTFEDEKKSKKDKKHKKDKSSSTKAIKSSMEFDKREMLPVGAISSDEDIFVERKRNVRGKRADDLPITRKKGADEVSALDLLL
jgi:AP-3 complex subunit delta